ncbi:MAG: sulfite exporter TauE/SafE family protein [Myxococcales bacterium]|nr:sulfite exporter TauE/SafE family protein [Myxococcales bacterium]
MKTRALVWPALVAVVWSAWALALPADVPFHETWPLAVAMLLGSFVAGATSEGGGAIAFPVMTLLFAIPPYVARDFGLMCQTVGMGSAALVILARRTPLATPALLVAGPSGALGLAFGLHFVAPVVSGPAVKLFFCALWAAFALAHRRAALTRPARRALGRGEGTGWLVVAGLVGGVVTSLVGTGVDILVFSILVLRLGLSETIATPTSVVLMAGASAVGFALRALGGGPDPLAWSYWWTCVPVVVVGAPLGARFIEGKSRRFLSNVLYASVALQLVGALVLLPLTPGLVLFGATTFVAGLWLFLGVARGARPGLEVGMAEAGIAEAGVAAEARVD